MARLLDKLARLSLVAIAVAAATALSQGAARKEIVLAMDAIEVQGDLMRAIHPRIVQDNMSIEADEALATGTNFDERSEWRFTGNVKINVENAVMEAGSAVFTCLGWYRAH